MNFTNSIFLFTWNPKRWSWDDFGDDFDQYENRGTLTNLWAIRSHKQAKIGDRAFFMKVGDKPKGIFASGNIVSEVIMGPHWSGENKETSYVYIEFDTLLNVKRDVLLDIDSLQRHISNSYNWTPQSSGMPVDVGVASNLEKYWFDFLGQKGVFQENQGKRFFVEGQLVEVIQSRYERNPKARQECLKHYGCSCQVCDLNFNTMYGELGRDFIHVHHLTPISSKGGSHQVDPIADLRPVCPNCHAMLHQENPPISIEQLRQIIISNRLNGE